MDILYSKEHDTLMTQFEWTCRDLGHSFEREDRMHWIQGIIYKNSEINNLFLAYRRGYAFGKAEKS